ncbi:DUF2267 domain-containing protein [Thiohalomonas denitrificans]|uniref:Uncharacterized conserved protein, DUF2267 family n=1 Tax=Thiohalomonas denitrificans TaxID=415747 RepID=A0A1G5QQL3_9GAMM|nr:DUF2267 domain-containing protein [Thiohalomonas denitrificans]SCZ64123.1 Uncharacterized conserved protein, DUF2267 family [Thiohalomonas denitrificans]
METDRMFWEQMERRWLPENDDLERDAVQSVLIHLRRRISQEEAEHLFAQLPPPIGSLSLEPSILQQEIEGKRPVDTLDASEFIHAVGSELEVPDDVAEQATEAVFGAVKRVLPIEETNHIAWLMPTDLREVWLRA